MNTEIPQNVLRAAECGDVQSQFDVGLYYYQGKLVPKDVGKAEVWWRKAADARNSRAQCMLGNIAYERKELATAEKWWRLAAEAGEPNAQYGLGFNCIDVIGSDESLRWTRKAANNGHSEAQKFLGFLTFWGGAVDRDRVAGMKWMILGAEGTKRSRWAPKLQMRFMRWFMTRDEVFRAEQQVRQWKEDKSKSSLIKL